VTGSRGAHLLLALALLGVGAGCSGAGGGPSAASRPTVATTAPSTTPATDAPASVGSPPASAAGDALRLVAIGDSVPYNLARDCPGCVGFVDSYGAALEERLGRPVDVLNRSRHDGAQTHDIVQELSSPGLLIDELRAADVVIVSTGFNDLPPFGEAYPGCPSPPGDEGTNAAWALALAETSEACIDDRVGALRIEARQVFARLRELVPGAAIGALTAYDAWSGWPELDQVDADVVTRLTAAIRYALDAWNTALCEEAAAAGAVCVDVREAFNGADGTRASGGLLATDYSHPSQAGNDLIRDVLLESELLGS
jgi:lysophospholipase L1-like esterase